MMVKNMLAQFAVAVAGTAAIALGMSGAAQADTVIDTTQSWNGSSTISSFGENGTPTYGQTFTVVEDNVLTEFSFFLNDWNSIWGNRSASPINFAAYVMQWDGAKALGDILWQSSPQSTTQASGLEQFTFNTGGTVLTQGAKYVAFFSTLGLWDRNFDAGETGHVWSDVYSGGEFVFSNNASSIEQLSQVTWDGRWFTSTDMAFTAKFSSESQAVPEPGNVAVLLGLGAMGAGATLKKKLASSRNA
jgi:hypothetical protein